MEALRVSASAACLLGIIFSVCENMIPSEKFKRQINVICMLILVLTIYQTVSGCEMNLSINETYTRNTEEYVQITDRLLISEIDGNICDSLNSLLDENGISAKKISLSINNFASDSIIINEAQVIISQSDNAEKAESIIRSALGDEVIITVQKGQ